MARVNLQLGVCLLMSLHFAEMYMHTSAQMQKTLHGTLCKNDDINICMGFRLCIFDMPALQPCFRNNSPHRSLGCMQEESSGACWSYHKAGSFSRDYFQVNQLDNFMMQRSFLLF